MAFDIFTNLIHSPLISAPPVVRVVDEFHFELLNGPDITTSHVEVLHTKNNKEIKPLCRDR